LTGVKLPPRHPLAFGITHWGPLPGTEGTHVQWDGPGGGMYLYPCSPERASVPGMRIRHETAAGTYDTLRQAERAVTAFIAAGSG
jgi:hypothetical protein